MTQMYLMNNLVKNPNLLPALGHGKVIKQCFMKHSFVSTSVKQDFFVLLSVHTCKKNAQCAYLYVL